LFSTLRGPIGHGTAGIGDFPGFFPSNGNGRRYTSVLAPVRSVISR